MAVILAACVWIVNSTRSDTRLFCSYGRVFIEFQDGNNTWGTLMLDDNGAPIRCNNDKVKTKLKDTI